MLDYQYQRVPAKIGLKQQQKTWFDQRNTWILPANRYIDFHRKDDLDNTHVDPIKWPFLCGLQKKIAKKTWGALYSWPWTVQRSAFRWGAWNSNGLVTIGVGFLNQKWMVCHWKRAQKLMSPKSCTRSYQYLFADSIRSWVSRNPSCDAAGFPFKVPGQILWINDSFFCVTCLFCRVVVESFTTSQPSSNQVHHSV